MNERSRHQVKQAVRKVIEEKARREERAWLMEKLWQLCGGSKSEIELLTKAEELYQ